MQRSSSSTNQQFISVVIPVYNEEANLKDCLDSLSKQILKADKIYVVDNNSTDNSVNIARSYNFVTTLHETTQGICASTKTGFDVASKNGGLILRLDADCHPEKDWIGKMSKHFSSDPSIIAVTGPGIAYDAKPIGKLLMTLFYMKPYFLLVGLALSRKPLFGSNLAICASTWQKISSNTHLASHQNIHDDIDISFHLLGQGKTIYDSSIKMPISSRPLKSTPRALLKRYSAGFRSIFIHWPQQTPWKNWLAYHKSN
jgi:glycosyltransferase involved in cell wall biosynthesis